MKEPTVADTTTGRSEAVKAVAGALAPEPPQAQVDDGKIVVTRDLKSEQDKDAKLDAETTKAMGEAEDQKVRAQRTLPNGKTEAVLAVAPPVNQFPPDDGGYNPEKRWFAGPADTKVPSAVGKNATSDDSDLIAAGWKPSQIKDKSAK